MMELELLDLSDADRAFRDELRAWLEANIDAADDAHRWHGRLVEGRWAVPSWPQRWGGRDATLVQQLVHAQLMGEFDAPPPRNAIGLFNIGPMLMEWATEEQQAQWLPRMVTAEDIWCQGFSEPGAGSDLASLSMRAEDAGDHWVVTGQKVWTSLGSEAVRCLALVRTDTSGRKHEGITALAIDLDAPGVDVRPLKEITGNDGFNEIFFDGVEVPKDRTIGQPGDGWRIAMSTLVHERLGAMKLGVQLRNRMDGLVELVRATGRADDPVVRQRLAELGIRVDLMQLLTQEAMAALARGADPGASLPLGKLQWSELMQELAEYGTQLQGLEGLVQEEGAGHGDWAHDHLYSRMTTIAAGTTQVQKNIIATRILGLPAHAKATPRPATVDPVDADADLAALRMSVRRFLDDRCPVAWVRDRIDDPRGVTDDVWKGLVALDLPGLLVPVEYGGSGLDHAGVAPVLFELGRALHPGPYLSSSVAAVDAIRLAGDGRAAGQLLRGIADGTTVATVVLPDLGSAGPPAPRIRAEATVGGGALLDGREAFVPDAAAADVLLVPAFDDDGLGLYVVDARAPGVEVVPVATVDPTRRFASVRLHGATGRRLGTGDQRELLERLADLVVGARVMDAAGAATRALEIANDYAKVRVQFDQPIGVFQAVQHLLADILRSVTLARAAADDALRAADGGDARRLRRAAAAAKAYGGDALHRATADVIQVLGGVGFTWEHDAHLYFKRAMTLQHTLGSSAAHRAAYAELLLRADPEAAARGLT